MKCIPVSTWAEIRTAYASGVGLRELARNMNIPAGTVLAHSKREGWTQQIAQAKLIERPELARELAKPDAINAITMQDRAARYVERMAGVTDRVLPHLEKMEPGEILDKARNVERFDFVARRNYGLNEQSAVPGVVNMDILCNQALVVWPTNPA